MPAVARSKCSNRPSKLSFFIKKHVKLLTNMAFKRFSGEKSGKDVKMTSFLTHCPTKGKLYQHSRVPGELENLHSQIILRKVNE